MDIPEDVMKAAYACWEKLSWDNDGDSERRIIAEAIMAERERCAKVAEEEKYGQLMLKSQAGAQNDKRAARDHESMALCASLITAAIRRGDA